MSSMYGKGEDISKITDTAHKKSIINTADVPKCQSLVVGVIDSNTSKKEHEDYTVAYVAYKENDETIYFDGAAWVEDDPSQTDESGNGGIANLKKFTIQ